MFGDEIQEDVKLPVEMWYPDKYPAKQDIRTMRKTMIEKLVGAYGYLKAYILIKFVEKLIADKEEGVIQHIKDNAADEFVESYGGRYEMDGVKISTRSTSYYEYPPEIEAERATLKKMELELKGKMKAAEIDGRATKHVNEDKSITITFG